MSNATWDTPAAPAYRMVSSTRFVNSSTTMKKPATPSGRIHPGSAARLTRKGATVLMIGPTYGMNRRAAASAAQSNGYGTPMKYSPIPTTTP